MMVNIIGRISLKFLDAVIVLFLLHINSGTGDYTNIRCSEGERRALLAFKNSLAVESKWLSTWGDENGKKECCKWQGVRCSNSTGHVVKLDLRAHNLHGKINPSLMELQYLEYLDLSFNFLVEDQNLKWLSHLSNLQYLDLSLVYLSRANDWLTVVNGLGKLTILKLSECSLPFPILNYSLSFINASSLVTVHLDRNGLSDSYPFTLLRWLFKSNTTLVSLDLSSNNIYGSIPSTFGKMMVLRELDLSDNQFQGMIPDSFGKMLLLRDLDLSQNQLQSKVPESFANLCHLRALNLSRNDLTGSLFFLHNFSSCANNSMLESLILHSNQFSGSLPDLSVFPFLKEIDIHYNKVNGNLPTSIGNLFELETLDVSYNHLEGLISEIHLSNLSKLTNLDLSSNSLSLNFSLNWIPSFRLEFLSLRSFKLGSNFLKWLATQKKLSYLDISDNEISDAIHKWCGEFIPNLYYLAISNNQIRGRLPNLSANFPTLLSLDLSSNSFEAPLMPPFPANLTILNLSNNSISGSISSLCNTTTLHLLDLSNNQLSGELPEYCVSRWSSLRILNLANNNFSGKIPNSIGLLSQIRTLNLRNNRFSGELPESLRECKRLILIDLSHNKLSGKVPLWIGDNLSSLTILILRSNKFDGSIPLNFCELINLQILDLGQNNIFGNIPQCISQLTAMTVRGGEIETHEDHGLVYTLIHPNTLVYGFDTYVNSYENKALLVLKGIEVEYSVVLFLLKSIDFSGNKLTGKFPEELLNLSALITLNLSRNNLSGELPQNMGEMSILESLDLSQNQFSGGIPTSLIELAFLSYFNLSYNNLYGRIPTGHQFQTFDNSSYLGNLALCGPPLTENCTLEATCNQTQQIDKDDADEFYKWFYMGMGMGFFIGFWGIFGSLCLSRTWRHAYFLFLFKLKDWLLLGLALHTARLQTRFNTKDNH